MKDSLLELDVQKTTATMAVGDIAAFKAEFTDVLCTFDDMMKTRANHLNDCVECGKLEVVRDELLDWKEWFGQRMEIALEYDAADENSQFAHI